MDSFVREVATFVGKDLRLEFRSREIFASMLLYTVLAGVLFAYAFSFQTLQRGSEVFFPGVLWVALTFSGTLGMGRLASREEENQVLLGLTLAPTSRPALFFAKVIVAVLLMVVLLVIAVPLFALMFSVSLSVTKGLAVFGIAILGAIGFAMVGTLVSALLLGARGREMLLPVALYPLVLPVLIFGVNATTSVLSKSVEATQEAFSSVQSMMAFDIVFAILGGYLFEQLLVE